MWFLAFRARLEISDSLPTCSRLYPLLGSWQLQIFDVSDQIVTAKRLFQEFHGSIWIWCRKNGTTPRKICCLLVAQLSNLAKTIKVGFEGQTELASFVPVQHHRRLVQLSKCKTINRSFAQTSLD